MCYSLDGCIPESTIVQDSIEIMWPELGITKTASVNCPCGTVSYIYYSCHSISNLKWMYNDGLFYR